MFQETSEQEPNAIEMVDMDIKADPEELCNTNSNQANYHGMNWPFCLFIEYLLIFIQLINIVIIFFLVIFVYLLNNIYW